MFRKLELRVAILATLAVLAAALVPVTPARAASSSMRSALAAISADGTVQPDNVWDWTLAPYSEPTPVGWVMVIHGGGWTGVGPQTVAGTLVSVTNLRKHGWGVYNVDYRAGEQSLPDVVAAYSYMRSIIGWTAPLCVYGQSAGAHLALMLAARKASVHCVISEAAPTDLASLPSQAAWAPAGVAATAGPEWTYTNLIVPTFGSDPATLAQWSPVTYASQDKAHILMGGSTYDPVIPDASQMAEMKAAAPDTVTTMMLDGEPTPAGQAPNFTHASITPAARTEWDAAELKQLRWEATDAAARQPARRH